MQRDSVRNRSDERGVALVMVMFMVMAMSLVGASLTFVSRAALEDGVPERLRLAKRVVAVSGTRAIRKRDLVHNGALPVIDVDPQTYEVRADGPLLTCAPATTLPLAQRYFLF